MTIFNQNNQKVQGTQNNIGGDLTINWGTIEKKSEVFGELIKIISLLNDAEQQGIINSQTAIKVKSEMNQAIDETKKSEPKSENIIEKINSAKSLIEGLASAGGLVKILIEATEVVKRFF